MGYVKPSIKINAIANYMGQAYVIIIGVVITPFYLQYLGAEAYGLVGFFVLLQAWLNLLDLGLSPTMGRQAACARATEGGLETFRRLSKSFEIIFIVLAALIVLIISLSSGWISTSWIKADSLDDDIVRYSIIIMGIIIALRWGSGLYKSAINGLEDQVWLNLANIVFSSLRFIGALILLRYFTQDVRHFFEYQLLVSIIEVPAFYIRFNSNFPKENKKKSSMIFDLPALKKIAPYALSVSYTAGIWVLITQTDKLILSGLLTLSEYGYFSMVALVAGGVVIVSGPISQAVMPRLIFLFSEKKIVELLRVYGKSSQYVTVISLSVAFAVGLYAEPLIYSWSGDKEAAAWARNILIWFSLGNGILAISAFQYYLQNSFGQLRLHVIGSTVALLIQVPLIFYAATNFGAIGAGIAWFSFRVIWFLIWTAIVHVKFAPGFHFNWMTKEILPIIIVTAVSSLFINNFIVLNLNEDRLLIFIKVVGVSSIIMIVSAISSEAIRKSVFIYLKGRAE